MGGGGWPSGSTYGNGRSKNDKNWENWERIREQKLELMKNICFESYRQSKRDRMLAAKPKPRQLHPSWYTDNIYSNRSEDLEEDYVPDCLKYGTYRKLRNIREQDEFYDAEELDMMPCSAAGAGRREEGEGSSGFNIQRSTSCKEFYCPKSHSCHSGYMGGYESGSGAPSAPTAPPTTSILKNRGQVPKSYSFSASTKTTPFDEMDYHIPASGNSRREKQEAYRRSMAAGYNYSSSLDESHLPSCCAREHCTNAKCLFEEIYPSYGGGRRAPRRSASQSMYGAEASGGSHRRVRPEPDWLEPGGSQHRGAAGSRYSLHPSDGERGEQPPPPPAMVCCCSADDYCCHRQQQHHAARSRIRLHCPGHHPAAEEEEHLHCRAVAYETDVDHFIRDERERLMLQDKFLDEDERYLSTAAASRKYLGSGYAMPGRSKSLMEFQPPSRYDEDSCSDSTDMDLEDFNIDLEKYWEELEKPPSPVDLDMQRRNMHSNLKVKNVNVGCYNNGQPIDMHDREQERMMIKKSLLEGMPSPPQAEAGHSGAGGHFNFFEHATSPLHRSAGYGNYGYKVYPAAGTAMAPADTLPSYKYNNFYPEHGVQTQQPTSSGHHPSAGGHSALSLINNIFSIYKPNKYSPHNCQMNIDTKPEPCKKMNVPSTRRPLGAPHSEYMHSMKRPLIVSNEQPHFKIIPEKTGLKISPLYSYDEYGDKPMMAPPHKLTSTARPLMLPH